MIYRRIEAKPWLQAGAKVSRASCSRTFHVTSLTNQAAPTELQTTDPLIAYRALAAKGALQEDAEQIRALVELRKLSRTLMDYTPPAHLLGILHDSTGQVAQGEAASEPPASEDNVQALVKHLSEEQELETLGTPRGLLLTGTPGTGKTFLVDLWFDHLPIRSKFRRHYHHLLLSIYRMIWVEAERRRIELRGNLDRKTVLPERGVGAQWQRSDSKGEKTLSKWAQSFRGIPFRRASKDSPAPVSSLDGIKLDDEANKGMDVIKLAQLERQEDSAAGLGTTLPMHVAAQLFLTHGHILLLDELQLLDIASATLLRRILTSYWRLGGVLVATSNRVPEDLYANNVQRRSLVAFLAALKERCPVVEVAGRDWRVDRWKDGWDKFALRGEKEGQCFFFLAGKADDDQAFDQLKTALVGDRKADAAFVKVYNRKVAVPEAYVAAQDQPSLAFFTFNELCDQPLAAADYLTLASTYEMIILDEIPALDLVHRNQARRLITLIDCLYESRTKLVIRSLVPLTKIFFAKEGAEVAQENERRRAAAAGGKSSAEYESDMLQSSAMIQSEVLSEAMQDTEEGFRPNVVAYGPIVEDENRPEPGRESKRQREERQRAEGGALRNLSIFSGEEERFAYQRAVSRLYEMSHASWTEVPWRPLMEADRSAWQHSGAQRDASAAAEAIRKSVMAATQSSSSSSSSLASEDRSEVAATDFADEASYHSVGADHERRRVSRSKGPPVLAPTHVWGVRDDWGPKAGKWGRGVRGIEGEESDEQDSESPRDRRARLSDERRRAG